MTSCPSCGSTNAAGMLYCAKCGKPLTTAVSPLVQNLRDDEIIRDLEERARLRHQRISHAITGAITFFILNLLIGLPGSLAPGDLLRNAFFSTLFGLPIGYLISWRRGGPVTGALISASAFVVVRLALGLFVLLRGGSLSAVLLSAFVYGILGTIPGAIIGIHVEHDV